MMGTTDRLLAVKDAKDTATRVWPNPRRPQRLLLAAAIFHLAVTITIYGLGRYAILPGTFDTHGIAVSFAQDGVEDHADVTSLSEVLTRGQIRDWVTAPYPFHLKLYSICFAVFGPLLGYTIISAEPLNGLCYLAILILVFKLGQEAFNRRSGLIAAATVALWPSFLLHTTQLLKDPLFLVGMLGFILIDLRLLSRSLSWPKALLTGVGGGLIAVFIWLARHNMGELLIATVALGAAMLIARQVREKQLHAANLVGMALAIVVSVGVTQVVPKFRKPDAPRGAALERPAAPPSNPWLRVAARVGTVRQRFVSEYPDSGSNLDSQVQLNSMADLIRYLPRAAAIGFFAPFPNMWFATGKQVGSGGRLLSGLETMAMYVVEGLAIVGLWGKGRKRRGRQGFSVWFLALVAAMGLISLGLVVVNVGALYRLRYVFLVLLILLAAEGAAQTLDWCRKKRSDGSRLVADA